MDLIFLYLSRIFPEGYGKHLETTGWYALAIPLLAIVLLLERRASRRTGKDFVGFAEPLSNLSAGLSTLVIGLFVGPLVIKMYNYGYGVTPLRWGDSWLRWPAALVAADLCYYLHHRAGHRFAVLWAIHGIHHQHEKLNSTVGLRLEWLADVSTIVFFALMPLLGFDAQTGFMSIALLSLYALTTHCPLFWRPSFGIFVTPGTHGAHHSRDARFAGKNYAAMFTFWDRLFGTYAEVPSGIELRRDLPTVCRQHDGIGAQWSLLKELAVQARQEPTALRALGVLFSRPVVIAGAETPRDEATIGPRARAYIAADFLATAALATWLLWNRGAGSLAVSLLAAAFVIWSLRTNGRLIDGRIGAGREHAVRLLCTMPVGLVLQAAGHPAAALGATVAAGGLLAAFFVLDEERSTATVRA